MFLKILRSNVWLEKSHLYSKNNFSLDIINLDGFEGGNGDHWPNHCKNIIDLFVVLFYWSHLKNTTPQKTLGILSFLINFFKFVFIH